jgi:EmrB/QacA subfamily drug resistance transporter
MILQAAPHQRWVLLLTSLTSLMAALDAMVVTTALTSIRDDFQVPLGTLQWTVNAYNLTFAVLLMTGAAMGERWGRRRVLSAGLVLFTIASALCGLAPGVGWLIAGRALQGAGAALAMPVAMALVGTAFSGPQRAAALGLFSSITGIALIAGPALGGAIAQGMSWPWIFLVNIPIGIVLTVLLLARVDNDAGRRVPIDVRGALLLTVAAAGLAWTLVRGQAAGWFAIETCVALAIAVAGGIAFAFSIARSTSPMVRPALLASAGLRNALGAGASMYAPLYGTLFLLPQVLRSRGGSVLEVGLELLPWTATLFVVAPFAGKAAARLGERRLACIGLALQGAGIALIGAMSARGQAYAALVPAMLVAGAGVSMAMPAVQSAAMAGVGPADIGMASGAFNTVRFFAGFCGVALVTAVVARQASGQTVDAGVPAAFAALAIISLAGVGFAIRLPTRPALTDAPPLGPKS